MALANGVLVHGPQAWACAVRTDDGDLKVVARRKRFRAASIQNPLLRGPARIAEAFALLPQVKRSLPEARLPMEGPRVLASMIGSAIVLQGGQALRHSPARTRAASRAPSRWRLLCLRCAAGSSPSITARSTSRSATYEHGASRPKEHERCGSHLIGPMLLTNAASNLATEQVPVRYRSAARAVGVVGAVAASVELFGWMTRHPGHPLARALAKPGHELQHRLGTREPSAAQLEVADAALQACLELEHDHDA